jgi:hypothetical protein
VEKLDQKLEWLVGAATSAYAADGKRARDDVPATSVTSHGPASNDAACGYLGLGDVRAARTSLR